MDMIGRIQSLSRLERLPDRSATANAAHEAIVDSCLLDDRGGFGGVIGVDSSHIRRTPDVGSQAQSRCRAVAAQASFNARAARALTPS